MLNMLESILITKTNYFKSIIIKNVITKKKE